MVSASQENITLTPIPVATKKDVDKKFFKNLLSVYNCSQTRITIKDKFTVADEGDNASTSTHTTVDRVNKGVYMLVFMLRSMLPKVLFQKNQFVH